MTIPKGVREALDLSEGDEIVFRVDGGYATISKVRDFIELAGSVPVPPGKHNTPWDEVIRTMRQERYGNRY